MRFPAFALLRFTFPHYDRSFFDLNGALALGDDQSCTIDRPCSLNDKYRQARESSPEEPELDLKGGHYKIYAALLFPIRKLKINGAGARVSCVEPSSPIHGHASRFILERGAFRLELDADNLSVSIFDVVISNCTTAFFMKSKVPVYVAFRNVTWIGNNHAIKIAKDPTPGERYIAVAHSKDPLHLTRYGRQSPSHAHFDFQDCGIHDGVYGLDVAAVIRTIVTFSRTDFSRTRHAIKLDTSFETHVRLSEGRMTGCSVACIELVHSNNTILEVDRYVFENNDRGISIGGVAYRRGLASPISRSGRKSRVRHLRLLVKRTKFDRNQAGVVLRWLRNSHVVFRATNFTRNRKSLVGSSLSTNTNVTLNGCEFHKNHADAIRFSAAKNITIYVSHCVVNDNAMVGLLVTNGSRIMIEVADSNFTGNARHGLKLVRCNSSDINIDRSVFQRSRSGVLIISSRKLMLQLTKTHFTHNLASGFEMIFSEASLVVDGGNFSYNGVAGVQCFSRIPNDDECEDRGHVEIANAVVRKNSLVGALLKGLRIHARFTDSSVNDNEGVGVNFDGGDTGSFSFKRCKILRNPLGGRFRVKMLSFQDSVINGSEDGIRIAHADVVKLDNVTVTDNLRGISCPHMHSSKRPTRKLFDWTATGFIYFNTESDLTFMLHPVLEKQPRFFHIPRPIRDWWPSPSWSYRVVTSFTIALGGILAAAMLLFLQAVLHTPSRKATQVGWIATSIMFFAITMGCTGRFVSEMVMRRWTLMSATWSQTQEQKQLLKKKLHLQTQIRNVELKKELAALQFKARRSILRDGSNSSSVEAQFRQMKAKAEEESGRLGAMANERRLLYDAEPERMAYLLSIPSERVSEPVQEDVGINQNPDDDEGYLRYIHEQAEWFLPEFSRILRRTIYCFNRVGDVRDLESLGLLPEGSSSKLRLSFEPEAHKLKPDRHATAVGIHCALKIGGVKRIDRALAKVRSDYCSAAVDAAEVRPLSRHVCDWLRATVITEDPYTLALLFHVFKHVLGLVRVKNNFANTSASPLVATNLLANFKLCWRGDVHVVEIQFLLQDFLSIKLVQHDYYDILRAESMQELCAKPVFDALSDDEEEDVVENIRQTDFFSKVMSLRNQSDGTSSVRVSRASVLASVPTVWGTFQSWFRVSSFTSGIGDRTDARPTTAMAENSLGVLRLHLADESTKKEPNIELAHVVNRRASIIPRMSLQSIRGVWRGRSESSDSRCFPEDD